ncbi:MAG: monovalent cation/H(+) antiporter subunit G [Lachnospiraceae bacterium]|nr:monovalent cation/H(+) antiporter subunit G [Lachnospiraceae bacterium]
MVREIIAAVLIVIGAVFSIVSVFGVFRFGYVLNRMHSAAMGDTVGILFVMIGLVVLSGFNFTSLKLIVIILFFWLAGPVSSHLLANLTGSVDKEHIPEIVDIDGSGSDNTTKRRVKPNE